MNKICLTCILLSLSLMLSAQGVSSYHVYIVKGEVYKTMRKHCFFAARFPAKTSGFLHLRIQGVPKAVAEEVEGQDDEADDHRGEDHAVRRDRKAGQRIARQ